MGKDQGKATGEIYIMQTINIGKRNEIMPIEWKKYEGENICCPPPHSIITIVDVEFATEYRRFLKRAESSV